MKRLAVLGIVLSSAASGKPSPHFGREVLPILSDKCFVCHGPDAEKDEVRLDSYEGAIELLGGGVRAIDPKDLDNSELLYRIHDEDDPMPPEDAEKQLTDEEREILTRWVKSGGKYEKHWAFVKPEKTAKGGIDRLIGEKLEESGTTFAPEATPDVLARRAALILTGLPPEQDQLQRFLKSGNYEALVDELLASDRFGEHQARYWLDAVRYGDTHGLHLDNRRGIFPYRDWVVKAYNDNLPIDDFITWQLAGDLLDEPTLEQMVATGYVRMNPSTSEGGAIPAEFQAKNNFDRTENFGTVFLGMTMNCVRCHTHKYDPIVHQEYYQLMAFFNNTSEGPLDGNKYEYKPVIKAPSDQADWEVWEAWEAKALQLLAKLSDEQRAGLGKASLLNKIAAIAKDKALPEGITGQSAELHKQGAEMSKVFTTTLVAGESSKKRKTFVLERGEYSNAIGEELQPDVLRVVNPFPADAPRNRLGLAHWVTSRENPLVARVLINRTWQSVFGEGLVRSPEDFGLQGQQPTHPKLLDWLAVEFQDTGWDHKKILKSMVMSRTFRQQSRIRENLQDPENRLFARGSGFRLDAEVIRDMGLWVSGLLDESKGGEGVKPYQPEGMWAALAHPASNTKKYVPDKGEKVNRRSLYVYWKRTSPHPMMTIFDAPSRESSCVRRSRSNTPLQSLGLFNEPQRVAMSKQVAQRLLNAGENTSERIGILYQWLACRAPDQQETKVCMDLLKQATNRYVDAPADAKALVGESENAPELAAWTQLTGVILASDMNILVY